MDPDRIDISELREAWRDATRATELAERLAAAAVRATGRADLDEVTAAEIATMAEVAATWADRAATVLHGAGRNSAETARPLRDEAADLDLAAPDLAGPDEARPPMLFPQAAS
jgi:hypothetical protein